MDTIRRFLCGWTITLTALAVTGAVFAQPEPLQRQGFEERVKAIASSFKSNPRLKKLPQTQLENLMNFMVGNMLFVLNHEMAHVIINDFHLPVLGDEEDAADDERRVRAIERQLAGGVCRQELADHQPAEQLRQHAHG